MRGSSLFLALVVGLLVDVMVLSTPSQADLVRVTVQDILPGFGSSETVSSVNVSLTTAAEPFTSLHLIVPPVASGSSISSSGPTVTILPSANANFAFQFLGEGIVEFSFLVPLSITAAQSDVISTANSFISDGVAHSGDVTLSFLSVPEPASWTMLGIGATGLLAFKRFFKGKRSA
jgi:hypothetical protein